MPRLRRRIFEGDAAAVELRSELASFRAETPMPAERRSLSRRLHAALRSAGLLMIAAAASGAAGYLAGDFGLIVRLRHIDPVLHVSGWVPHIGLARAKASHTPSSADLVPVPSRAAANFRPAGGGSSQLPAPRAAVVDIMPAGGPRAAGRKDAAPPPAAIPAVPARDPAEIAAKTKLGADLLASGDIAAARLMFARVAEAGEAAGAFGLAETYDPAVLRTLRLRGAIASNSALARHWYEQARDMGSAAAIERIARLAQSTL